ncbi:MAG: hypothetical protein ACKOCA_03185 [Vulcanococcus sp.]
MAVASPYAVFRAVDLGWPLAMPALREPPQPASLAPATGSTMATASGSPRKRSSSGLRRRTPPQWNTLIQGELFPA